MLRSREPDGDKTGEMSGEMLGERPGAAPTSIWTIRSLSGPDSAFDLHDLSWRSVAALLAMAPGGRTDVSTMLREILARPSQVSPLMRLAADAIAARAALVRLRRMLGPSFSWE